MKLLREHVKHTIALIALFTPEQRAMAKAGVEEAEEAGKEMQAETWWCKETRRH